MTNDLVHLSSQQREVSYKSLDESWVSLYFYSQTLSGPGPLFDFKGQDGALSLLYFQKR